MVVKVVEGRVGRGGEGSLGEGRGVEDRVGDRVW